MGIDCGGLLGVGSASFQTMLYMAGGAPWYIAAALSFLPIVIGEVGLALLESSYSKEHEVEHDRLESVRLQAELDAMQSRLTDMTAQAERADTLQQELSHLQNENASLVAQATASHQQAAELEQIATERDELAAKCAAMAASLQRPMIDIELLPTRLRDELQTAISIIAEQRIVSQNDFIDAAKWSRTKAQDVFKTAQALGLVMFENSTKNAFVVREKS